MSSDRSAGRDQDLDPTMPDLDHDPTPLVQQAHHLAGAIYGTILATSIVAAAGGDPSKLNRTFIIVLLTSVVFWAAHVYALAVGARITARRALTRVEIRRIAVSEWPVLQSSWPILAALLLGSFHIVDKQTASYLAVVVGIGALFTYGLIAGRQEGVSRLRVALNALITTSFGLVILAMKILVH